MSENIIVSIIRLLIMSKQSHLFLLDLLNMPDPDVNRLIKTFVTRFNKAYGNAKTDCWDISKEDWQRYEFLGDRVINLVVAQALFTRRDCILDEGEMTKILSSVVSNEALTSLAMRIDPQGFAQLVPTSIGEQNSYGKRIIGGAFEAFIGALYCEVGFDDVAFFINTIMADSLNHYDPLDNAVGILQEYFQKLHKSTPFYHLKKRTGPDHKPFFMYQVLCDNEVLGEGSGETTCQAKQAAAKRAIDIIKRTGSELHPR
jgi:ribonuclease-3